MFKIVIVFAAMLISTLFADPVLRTGQTLSYGQTSNNPVSRCSVKDDGCYRAGEEFNYTRNSKGIVTDHVTNLEWQDTSIKNRTWYDAKDHCNALTLDGGGWRLPTIRESDSIINYSKSHHTVDDIFQSNPGGNYWSATSYSYNNSKAWAVRFVNWGYSFPTDKTNDVVVIEDPETNTTSTTYYYVRCVRGQSYGNPDLHRSNNIVTDRATGLEWQDDTNAKNIKKNWIGAINYCESKTLGSYTNWRLPNQKELLSITDHSRYNLAIDTTVFQNIASSTSTYTPSYWSSTTRKPLERIQAWHVSFKIGHSYYNDKNNSSEYVRCVRENIPPTADAGPNKIVEVKETVTITGSGSDTDGSIAAYEWKKGNTVLSNTASFDYTPTSVSTETLTLIVTDDDGATGSDSMTVKAVDTTPPEITLKGANPMSIIQGSTFTDPGATATDNVDGNVPVSMSGTVDTSRVSSYTRTYTVIDAAGNKATKTRTVNVLDATPPEITLKGANPMEVVQGSIFTDPGASATDSVDGYVPVSVSGTVDTSTVGTYMLTYSATDAAGNTATETRTVHVVDITPPEITLKGANPMSIVQGSTFTDPGATAQDDVDGNVPVSVSGTVDTSTVSTYTLTYSATDAAGNTATETRTVHVVDITPPEITLKGANPMSIVQGSTFTDPGATAQDNVDGNVPVSVSGTVDTSTVGTYTLTYSATDTAGNTATETRTVHVVAKASDWYTVSPDGNTYTATGGSKVTSSGGFDDVEVSEDKIAFKTDCLTIEMKSNGEIITGYQSGCSAKAGWTAKGAFAPGTKVSVQSDGSIIIDAPLISDLVLGGK